MVGGVTGNKHKKYVFMPYIKMMYLNEDVPVDDGSGVNAAFFKGTTTQSFGSERTNITLLFIH